jgi:hypothetical protein
MALQARKYKEKLAIGFSMPSDTVLNSLAFLAAALHFNLIRRKRELHLMEAI